MYEGLATKEMLQKRWRKDAEYEVGGPVVSIAHPYFIGLLTRRYMQDPYTRCKGLSEIAPQVSRHCSPAVDAPC